jgi:tight adherence protein B
MVGALVLAAVAVVAGWPLVHRRLTDPGTVRTLVSHLAERPGRAIVVAAGAAAVAGLLVGGWVAAVVLAVYGALSVRALVGQSARRRVAAVRARSLDELCSLAADLRAGLPPAAVTSGRRTSAVPYGFPPSTSSPADPAGFALASRSPFSHPRSAADPPSAEPVDPASGDPRIAELSAAVWRLAEQTGAPAADLVERIEADTRAADRAARSAAAQSAGAQVTALLLAALPLGGIALGYGIGADPLHVLLHTGLGAACAIGAVLLQSAGLLWADRLVTGPAR